MHCVNCGRIAGDEDTQCPYCGCPVLSPHAKQQDRLARQVRTLWDETEPGAGGKVVPLPVAPPPPRHGLWLAVDALVWLALWTGLAALLGVLTTIGAWIVFALALAVNVAVLRLYQVRPLCQRIFARSQGEERGEPEQRTADDSRVSGL